MGASKSLTPSEFWASELLWIAIELEGKTDDLIWSLYQPIKCKLEIGTSIKDFRTRKMDKKRDPPSSFFSIYISSLLIHASWNSHKAQSSLQIT